MSNFSHDRLKTMFSLGLHFRNPNKAKKPSSLHYLHRGIKTPFVVTYELLRVFQCLYINNNILVIHLSPRLKMGDLVSCQLVSINTTDYIYKFLGQI